MSRCPHCGSKDFLDTNRLEKCYRCKYEFYYGDAHAPTEEARSSKEINPGDPKYAKPDPEEDDPVDWRAP